MRPRSLPNALSLPKYGALLCLLLPSCGRPQLSTQDSPQGSGLPATQDSRTPTDAPARPPQPAETPHYEPQEIFPGLYTPDDYGYSTWAALDARVRRNLAMQLADLARLEVTRGHREQAHAAAEESLSITLEFNTPADVLHGTPAWDLDQRSDLALDQRLQAALAEGWFGHSAFCHLSLQVDADPGQALRLDADLEALPPRQASAAGVRWLLAARQAQAQRRTADAQAAAQRAGERLSGALEERLELTRQGQRNRVTEEQVWLVGDPFRSSSPWGLLSPDYVLQGLADYLAEAAEASGQAALVARAAELQAETQGLLQERRQPGVAGVPWWTSPGGLARVPA